MNKQNKQIHHEWYTIGSRASELLGQKYNNVYTSEHFVFENIPKLGDCKAIRKGLIKMTYIWLGVKTFLETCEKHA